MKRNLAILALVAVLITLLLASAVLNYRHRQRELAARPPQVEWIPGASPSESEAASSENVMPDGSPSLKGKAAQDFTLKDLAGKTVTLSSFRGKPVVVNFWATWCAPCKVEIPWFIKLYQQYNPQGLVLLGVTAEDIPQEEVAKAAKQLGINYPVLQRGDRVSHDWGGLDGLPTSFYINRNGVIEDETVGLYSRDEVEAKVRKLLAPAPPGAQNSAEKKP